MVSLIESLIHPLEVQPTNEKAWMAPLAGIKAVVFDIYGTLLISGSGDTGVNYDESAAEEAMMAAFNKEGIVTTPTMELAKGRQRLIAEDHARSKAAGTEFPEVEIREIWKRLLEESRFAIPDDRLERVIMRHECAVNPVWPMPEAKEVLTECLDRGLSMGIISNAQFYTRPLLECLLGGALEDLGFRKDLCLWSFEEREAKPSPVLFARLGALLEREGIGVEGVLYVGNDMRNDIAPAAAQGFRTALFAGDARSLRWREEDGLTVRPDLVLTELDQLIPCLS